MDSNPNSEPMGNHVQRDTLITAADELQAIAQRLADLRQLLQTNRDALAATLARLKEATNE